MKITRIAFAALLLLSLRSAVAQLATETVRSTVSERIQVTLVEVPVNVVDRNGDPVRNLTRDNFELFDSGKHRDITHFDVIDLGATAKEQQQEQIAVAHRNFLLLFDLNSSQPGTLSRARQAARNFVAGAEVAGDRIAVGTFNVENGFRLLTSFTTDMKLVAAAIDTLGAPRYYQPADPLLLSALEMHAEAALLDSGSTRGQALAEEARETARLLDRAANAAQRQFITRTLDGYTEIAHLLDRVPGRKQVILLTEGFDAKMLHGRESDKSAQAKEEQQMLEHGEIWKVDTDNRYGSTEALSDLQEMARMCRRADVVFHAIDIKGLRAPGDVTATPQNSNQSLYLVTRDTGGMVFTDANNLNDDFHRLLHAQEVVYVLGFEAPSSSPGKFHDLKVKLVKTPSADAFHRAGYFESSVAATPIERMLTAGEIIMNQLPASDLGIAAAASAFPRKEGRAQVPVIVEIDGPSLLRAAKGNQIQSEAFIYAFDEKNIIRDFVHQTVGLDVSKLHNRLQQHGVRLYETLMLEPGKYSIRTLVRAGAQPLNGFSASQIEIPAYGQPAVLGGSAFDEKPQEWVGVKPPDRPGVPSEYPFVIGGADFMPSAAPVLRAGVLSHVGLFVVAGNVAVTASVNGREVPVKISGRTTQADGTVKLLLDFVPPELPAGEYVLALRVPAATAKDAAAVRFAVR
jgi:VWFA-related protein